MKVYNAADIELGNNMYLIYGAGGTGKTTTAKYFEGKKLLITLDQSQDVAKGWKNTVVVEPEKDDWNDIFNWIPWLLNEWVQPRLNQFDMVIIDNISNVEKVALEQVAATKNDNRQAYQEVQSWYRRIAETLRLWNKTIYVTGWETTFDETDSMGVKKTIYTLDLNAKARNAFAGLFDVVGRIHADDTGQRTITLQPDGQTFAKNRLNARRECLPENLFNGQDETKTFTEPKVLETEEK